MRQNAPYHRLDKLPPLREKVETIEILRQTNISSEAKEVVNYRKATFHGFDLAKEQGFLRVNDIVGIQQELVDNTAGIRSTPGTVLKNDKTGEIIYTPPQDKAPKVYRKELVELLLEQPYSKIEFVVNKLGVERKAASGYLKELESVGILESQKVGRETIYIIKILKQE